jgi:hypothetical protein
MAWRLDPSMLMEAVGLKPDPWQSAILWSTAKRTLLLASRQIGKSTTVAAMALHTACFCDGSLTLLIAPTERQASELFGKLMQFYRVLRPVQSINERALSLELANGSRVVTLPGSEPDNVRGYSAPSLVVCDEASRVSDELYAALMPMVVANAGRLVLLSTPKGKRGRFWEWWESNDASWERIAGRASESVRITPEALAEQRASLGERLYAQEFDLAFLDSEDSVFTQDSIARLFVDDTPDNGQPVWQDFWLGLDLGSLLDYAALTVMRRWRAIDPATGEPEQDMKGEPKYRFDVLEIRRWPLKTEYTVVVADVVALVTSKLLPSWPRLAIDRSGVGGPVVSMIRDALGAFGQVEVWGVSITGGSGLRLAGWRDLHVAKPELIGALRVALEGGKLKVDSNADGVPIRNSDVLRRELTDFTAKLSSTGTETTGGKSEHDDTVIAACLPLIVGDLRPCRMIEFLTAGEEPSSVFAVRRSFAVKSAFVQSPKAEPATKLSDDDADFNLDELDWQPITR